MNGLLGGLKAIRFTTDEWPIVYSGISGAFARPSDPLQKSMSQQRRMTGGWVDRKNIPRGPNGRGLCRWCSLEVPPRRFTFCSDYCVHEWKLRTQPGYLREQVFLRDKGVCAVCHVDTVREQRRLRYSRGSNRQALLAHWGLRARVRKSFWDADHIVPVAEGGGECDLDNIQTLCLRCHREATKRLRQRMTTRRGEFATTGVQATPL
jgi:5-methylcytosine-specific restriction protein A